MYKVKFSKSSRSDLRNAALYIADNLGNKIAANNLTDKAYKELSSLSDFPERNPLVRYKRLASKGVRMQRINNYLAFYVIDSETQTVTILRVIHSRRDWVSILKNEMGDSQD